MVLIPGRLLLGRGAVLANDVQSAGLGVAYHAKPKVADAAHARIDHGDLTALLYIQGYARADFVVDTSGEFDSTRRQIHAILQKARSLPKRRQA